MRQVRSLRERGGPIDSLMTGFASSRATIYRALRQDVDDEALVEHAG